MIKLALNEDFSSDRGVNLKNIYQIYKNSQGENKKTEEEIFLDGFKIAFATVKMDSDLKLKK